MAEVKQDRYAAVLQEWRGIEQRHQEQYGAASLSDKFLQREKLRFMERAEAVLEKPATVEERLSANVMRQERRKAELAVFPPAKEKEAPKLFNGIIRFLRALTRSVRYTSLRIDGLEQQRVAGVAFETRMLDVQDGFKKAGMVSMVTKLQNQHEAGIEPQSVERRQFIGPDKILHAQYVIGQDGSGLPQITEYLVQRKSLDGAVDAKHRFDAREVGILSDSVMSNALDGRPFKATNHRGQSNWYMLTDGTTQMLDQRGDLTATLKTLPLKALTGERVAEINKQLEKGAVVEAMHRDGSKVSIRLGYDLQPVMTIDQKQAKAQGQQQQLSRDQATATEQKLDAAKAEIAQKVQQLQVWKQPAAPAKAAEQVPSL